MVSFINLLKVSNNFVVAVIPTNLPYSHYYIPASFELLCILFEDATEFIVCSNYP